MHLPFSLLTLWLSLALAQQITPCSSDLVASDDCAAVIDANACYNEFGFSGTRTLQCIDGKDDADRKWKACKCCGCVGVKACNWVTQQKFCSSTAGAATATASARSSRVMVS